MDRNVGTRQSTFIHGKRREVEISLMVSLKLSYGANRPNRYVGAELGDWYLWS